MTYDVAILFLCTVCHDLLQLQISELTNGVINTAFLMLYKVCVYVYY